MKVLIFFLVLVVAFAVFKLPNYFDSKEITMTISDDIQALNADGFSFLVLGDWGREGEYYQKEVAWQMGITSEKTNSRFVFTTGDNFYDDGVESVSDELWQLSFEDIYTAESLMCPWYAILGNHDYRSSFQAQIDYSKSSDRWRMPDKYYAFEKSINDSISVQFIAIDTSPFLEDYRAKQRFEHVNWEDPEIQLRWLDSTLAASKSDWKIVFGHHPIYSAGTKHGDTPELIAMLKPVLEKHDVQAYFSGHEHDLQHLKAESNLHYFISGGGSKIREAGWKDISLFSESAAGFMLVTFMGNEMMVRCIDHLGNILYTTTLSQSLAKEYSHQARNNRNLPE